MLERETGTEVGVLEAVVGLVRALHLVDLSLVVRVEQGDTLCLEQSQRLGDLVFEHVEEPLRKERRIEIKSERSAECLGITNCDMANRMKTTAVLTNAGSWRSLKFHWS